LVCSVWCRSAPVPETQAAGPWAGLTHWCWWKGRHRYTLPASGGGAITTHSFRLNTYYRNTTQNPHTSTHTHAHTHTDTNKPCSRCLKHTYAHGHSDKHTEKGISHVPSPPPTGC